MQSYYFRECWIWLISMFKNSIKGSPTNWIGLKICIISYLELHVTQLIHGLKAMYHLSIPTLPTFIAYDLVSKAKLYIRLKIYLIEQEAPRKFFIFLYQSHFLYLSLIHAYPPVYIFIFFYPPLTLSVSSFYPDLHIFLSIPFS